MNILTLLMLFVVFIIVVIVYLSKAKKYVWDRPQKELEHTQKFCSYCGMQMEKDSRFCSHCGYKVN